MVFTTSGEQKTSPDGAFETMDVKTQATPLFVYIGGELFSEQNRFTRWKRYWTVKLLGFLTAMGLAAKWASFVLCSVL
jgi:hypothetical protein